jgi:hypothetical protein
MKKMRFFKVITAILITAGLVFDFCTGWPLNKIYVFALIAVLFT